MARLYAALLEPGRLLSTDLLAEATSPQSEGYCPILHEDVTFGLGFKPTVPRRPFGPNPGSFGHFGTGGAVGFADPVGGVAFGYVMNHVIPRWQSTRNRSLIDAALRVASDIRRPRATSVPPSLLRRLPRGRCVCRPPDRRNAPLACRVPDALTFAAEAACPATGGVTRG